MAGFIRRGENRWLVRVFMGRSAEGKTIYHSRTVTGNKKAARAYAREVETERDNGTWIPPTRMTLGEYLDKWLAEGARGTVQPRTFDDYKEKLDRYVRPLLGRRRLSSVTPLDVQELYNTLRDRGLSGRTVQYAHAVLSHALNQAVGWRLLPFNPAAYTKRPERAKKEIKFLLPEEAEAFVAEARKDPQAAALVFALATGMRPEEYLALAWEHLDLDAGTASVRRVLVWRTAKQGGWYFGPPKTAGSRRTVRLAPSLVADLREHRRRQLEERLKAGPRYQPHDLVFAVPFSPYHPDAAGGPLAPRNLHRRHMRPALERAELDTSLHLYCLRHSYATIALAAGIDPKAVSESMGHSSVAFTQDTYQHTIPAMREAASATLDALLFKPAKPETAAAASGATQEAAEAKEAAEAAGAPTQAQAAV